MTVGINRLLVVCPSWLGDAVMATPALGLLRARLPGAFIGGLVRPGIDEALDGAGFFDEVHADRAAGVMGPKRVADRVRPRRYDTALLLTNSFSTALVTRLAFIPRRVGYDRDGRGLLLTDRLQAERRRDGGVGGGGWACVPAVEYYLRAARAVLGPEGQEPSHGPPPLRLGLTPEQQQAGEALLARAGVAAGDRVCIVNPGANDPAKRWPAERFGAVAAALVRDHGAIVLVNGSPAEADLADAVVAAAAAGLGGECGKNTRRVVSLPRLGITIGALKAVAHRCAVSGGVLVTNDTGPRHLGAAFGAATVTLYGPTDPRWTTLPPPLPGEGPRIDLVADPELPPDQLADDHPERCRTDRIGIERVLDAVRAALTPSVAGPGTPSPGRL